MTTTIIYGTDQHMVIGDTVTEITDNTAYVSRSGMIHLENCSTVTRMITSMSVRKVTITTTQARQKLAKGAKGCASCEKIAASRAAEYAENDKKIAAHLSAPEADTDTEVAEEPQQLVEIAIVRDGHGDERVHDAKCADVKREAKRTGNEPYYLAAATREDAARDWYGEVASDNYEEGTPEWEQHIRDCVAIAMTFLPCCTLPSAEDVADGGSASVTDEVPSSPRPSNKAQLRVWNFLSARPGEVLTVGAIVKGLAEEGEKTWYRATNDALRTLAMVGGFGILGHEGEGPKAYSFKA